MADFRVHLTGQAEFTGRMRQAPAIVGTALRRAVDRCTALGERGSKTMVPVDTGHLRRSITASRATFAGGVARGAWGTNVPYARPVHDGRRAGAPMPPAGALTGWLRRHGIPIAAEFVVRRAIGQRGIPPRRFLADVLTRLEPRFRAEFDQARREIVAALAGRR
jgi:hypothetical protein